jgi:hypothetical protein
MSALAARRAQYQASQNEKGAIVATGAATAAGTGVVGAGAHAGAVRWSTADERALEEVVARAQMGLLFAVVKTYCGAPGCKSPGPRSMCESPTRGMQ